MPFRFDRFCLLTVLVLASWVLPVSTWSASVPVGDGHWVFVFLQSLEDSRDRNIIKQTYDYSCGAAALATLLTYGLGDHMTEREILLSALAPLPEDEAAVRKKEGLSLTDLQRVVQERGHKAQGFRLAPGYLTSLRGPVIVFITTHGHKHFTVLKASGVITLIWPTPLSATSAYLCPHS